MPLVLFCTIEERFTGLLETHRLGIVPVNAAELNLLAISGTVMVFTHGPSFNEYTTLLKGITASEGVTKPVWSTALFKSQVPPVGEADRLNCTPLLQNNGIGATTGVTVFVTEMRIVFDDGQIVGFGLEKVE